MKSETTPHTILSVHYGTHSANRVTTIEEFNKDAEFMIKVKALFLEAEMRWRNDPTEFRRSVADRVKKWCFTKSNELRNKHWKKTN
jgi:hypothetical protein